MGHIHIQMDAISDINNQFYTKGIAMFEDVKKTLGFGTLLDWRYRQGIKRLILAENAATAEEFYAGPDAEALLSDTIMVDFLFPFIKFRVSGVMVRGISRDTITAMETALDISQEGETTKDSLSLCLEAGVLCRLPEGKLMPDDIELRPLAQFLYEKLFFDARPFLASPEVLCRLLFSDMERLARRSGYDILSKVMAYALGFKEYSRWRTGTKTKAIKAVQTAMHSLNDYLTGLELLEKDRPEDWMEGHCRLFKMLPDIVASANGSSEEAERRHREYLLNQSLGLVDLLAKIPGMNSEGAAIFNRSVLDWQLGATSLQPVN